jgi:hypothetical protein
MAVRSDVSVAWQTSPRVISVAAPSTTITVQDLYDTLRDIEQQIPNLIYPVLVSAGGKETLGPGRFVGVSATLLDAVLEFEARYTKNETGTVTTADPDGVTLDDSAATFVTNGVAQGDLIHNETDDSWSTVVKVGSETQIVGRPLSGGTDDDYDFGDVYSIYDVVRCDVNSGNLVAVDSAGDPADAISQTFGTHVTIEQSTSPALLGISQEIVEGNVTLRQAIGLILAAEAGKTDGAGSPPGPFKIRDTQDLYDRITSNYDANGNRTSITLVLTGLS